MEFLPLLSTFSLLMCKEGLNYERRRSYGLLYLSLSFYVIIFSLCNWLTQWSKWVRKDIVRSLVMFFRTPLPSLHEGLWLECKVWSLGAIRTFAYSVIQVTGFGSCWGPTHHGSIWILCRWGIAIATYEWGSKEQVMHIGYIYSRACSIVP